jgi:signal transduction histidine kinase
MSAYWQKPGRSQANAIRVTGQEITASAERIGERERAALAVTVQQSQRVLFFGVAAVVLLVGVGGPLLARAAVRPLRQLEAELVPIAAGRFAHFPEVSRDREIISLTAALNRMLDELEARRRQVLHSEKLASLGVLASGVAHELNNPLGNISSSCQILLEELDDADIETLRRWLGEIDGETQRAQGIVRILLDYARRRTFTAIPVALDEIVEQSRLLLKNPLREVELSTRLAPGLTLLADAPRLQQVFINLVKNAVDAGAAHIAIGAEPVARDNWPPPSNAHVVGTLPPADKRGVVVWVADDGPGISPETLSKVFDPFFTTREPGQGVGLGLYIVEEIVQEHGGCVAAESPATGGARFTLWLPAAEPERTA